MSTHTLQPVDERGWRMGFGNLIRKENGLWWATRTWWVQALIWLLILNGLLAAVLWAVPQGEEVPSVEAIEVFFIIGGMATGIGITIIMEGAVIDERRSGTLAWILSKPVSRTAFLLAKLIANSAGALAIMVGLQGVVAYLQLRAAGHEVGFLPFLGGVALLGLHMMFYLTLTLALSAATDNRGLTIAAPLLVLFSYQFLTSLLPFLTEIMPWGLVYPVVPGTTGGMASLVAQGQPLPSITPIIATVLWCVLFVGGALWRFAQEEF